MKTDHWDVIERAVESAAISDQESAEEFCRCYNKQCIGLSPQVGPELFRVLLVEQLGHQFRKGDLCDFLGTTVREKFDYELFSEAVADAVDIACDQLGPDRVFAAVRGTTDLVEFTQVVSAIREWAIDRGESLETIGGFPEAVNASDLSQQLVGFRHESDVIFELTGFLGRGACGVVFTANQTIDGESRQVAVKVFLPEHHELGRHEGASVMRLSHASIPKLYHQGTLDHRGNACYYLLMEYVRGIPADDFVANNELTCETLLPLLEKVAGIVAAVHDQGFAHGDLKPSHLLVSDDIRDPTVSLIDFGFAERHAPNSKRIGEGTVGYIDPKLLAYGFSDRRRSDVYSLGVVFQTLLSRTGSNQEPRNPRRKGERIERDVSQLIECCIDSDVKRRLPTARVVCHRLAQIRGILQQNRAYPTRRVALILFAAVIGLGGVVFGLMMGRTSPAELRLQIIYRAREYPSPTADHELVVPLNDGDVEVIPSDTVRSLVNAESADEIDEILGREPVFRRIAKGIGRDELSDAESRLAEAKMYATKGSLKSAIERYDGLLLDQHQFDDAWVADVLINRSIASRNWKILTTDQSSDSLSQLDFSRETTDLVRAIALSGKGQTADSALIYAQLGLTSAISGDFQAASEAYELALAGVTRFQKVISEGERLCVIFGAVEMRGATQQWDRTLELYHDVLAASDISQVEDYERLWPGFLGQAKNHIANSVAEICGKKEQPDRAETQVALVLTRKLVELVGEEDLLIILSTIVAESASGNFEKCDLLVSKYESVINQLGVAAPWTGWLTEAKACVADRKRVVLTQ